MSNRIFYPISSGDFQAPGVSAYRKRHNFGDARLSRKYSEIVSQMENRQAAVLRQLSDQWGDQMSYYRFINNDRVGLPELIDASCQIAPELIQGRELLVALDTCSVCLYSRRIDKHLGTQSLGVVDNNQTPGHYLHPSFIFDERSKFAMGLGDIVLFSRPRNQSGEAARNIRRRKLPLEEKESYVWSLSAANTQRRLSGAKGITYLLDQGGDKYESLARLVSETAGSFIVRSKFDRQAVSLSTDSRGKLSELLSSLPWMGQRKVSLRELDHYSKTHGRRIIRQAREASLRIRFLVLKLEPPRDYSPSKAVLPQRLSLIEVCETSTSVPEAEKPIHWRLLSNRLPDGVEAAWHLVDCYKHRWIIEQLFRAIKKKGFDLEHTQLKDPNAVRRQAVMALKAASTLIQLTLARENTEWIPIETLFDSRQQQVLHKANQQLSGNTPKSANPFDENGLAWAAWVIARLGGWKGYQSQRPPGPITFHRGMKRLADLLWATLWWDDS